MSRSIRSNIRDNRLRGSPADFIRDRCIEGSRLSIVSAYFTSAAYGRLSATLDQAAGVRFLFGEPRFLSVAEAADLRPPAFALTEDGLALADQLRQRPEADRCAQWIRERVEIRSVRRAGLLHGKMLHVDDGRREHALIGSSNFTVSGLGLFAKSNIELNMIVDGDRDREDLKVWFDELWTDAALTVDVKDDVLARLEQIAAHNSPEFIYHKTLFHLFEGFLDEEMGGEEKLEAARFTETAVWRMLYPFQRDGVRAVLSKLDRLGGCVLADSVGLGKTFTALAVIKWHELRNQRVLVLCPKKLRENWTEWLAANNSELNLLRDDRLAYTVLSHTDLSRDGGKVGDIDLSRINWGGYDLVVIDESHAFRSSGGARYQRLLEEVVRAGVPSRVLMLSATPVNNDLADLRAQLELIAKDRQDAFAALGVSNLTTLIGQARKRFAEWVKVASRDPATLQKALPPAFTTLLDGVSLARSRGHIERHYREDIAEIGRFPRREKPINLTPPIDSAGLFPSFEEIDRRIGALSLALYNPFAYVRPEARAKYDRGAPQAGFGQANRERYLIAMLKAGFLKRLESSVNSFETTMRRLVARIDERLAAIETLELTPPDDGDALSDEAEGDDDLAQAFEVGGRLRYDLRDLDVATWRAALLGDRAKLEALADEARIGPARDAKLAELKRIVRERVGRPSVNRDGRPNRKLILFTAYTDTARYLHNELEPLARELGLHTGLVTGTGAAASLGRARYQEVLANFAPVSKKRAGMRGMPEGEIDLLIATDCISEGQNLQDGDTVVNVDVHWNPVRLIQRFGRIDRLASLAETVRMINFWPTDDLNAYLNLRERVEARMALVDLSATGEDNLLTEVRDAAEADSHWRDDQLKRLRAEVFDLEEARGGVGLGEFTLDEFRADLLGYAKTNLEALRDAPLGLHALAPATTTSQTFDPGALFCLRKRGPAAPSALNPLEPFYLVYVRDDGGVSIGFGRPKSALAAMEALCSGRSEPFEALCRAFDQETANGARMDRFDILADAAICDIAAAFADRAAERLASDRRARLPDGAEQATGGSGYDLVTWLVVRPGDGT